ncbi:MAG: DUF4385 domain-containing protein [Patescibacteria group bacterium]
MPFPYHLNFDEVDFRQNPELYRIGVGEQGVLLVQPYKAEILPFWKFKTVDVAQESSQKIFEMFEKYLDAQDFVGADMARKFLQMGFTRARRYANHKSGRKYSTQKDPKTSSKLDNETVFLPYPYSSGSKNKANPILQQEQDWQDNEKAQAAQIFKTKWDQARQHPLYLKLKQEFIQKYGK